MWKFLEKLFGEDSPKAPLQNVGETNRNPNALPQRNAFTDYPKTFPRFGSISESNAAQIFEPALLHYSKAFRLGDPIFENAEAFDNWHDAKRRVIDYLLGIIDDSRWGEHLVLRGSLLLKAWFGEKAREPGDIDWVFRPATVKIDNPQVKEFFDELKAKISENPFTGNVQIDVEKIETDDIWTYERAAGKRLLIPWQCDDIPPGSMQMDIVFNEALPTEPVRTLIPNYRDSSKPVLTVDKDISLAWKLLWLETDMYPQGKDLYDAVLLAEQTNLSLSLLRQVLESSDERQPRQELKADFPMNWEVDWINFKLEYPWVEGTANDWQTRLRDALAPTFKSINTEND